jgi:hypothetical protein
MGFLYFEQGITSSTPGPFSNVGGFSWSGTVSATDPGSAWGFSFVSSVYGTSNKSSNGYAWAVRSHDVGAVPLPAAAWLYGSGLFGLLGMARRKTAQMPR